MHYPMEVGDYFMKDLEDFLSYILSHPETLHGLGSRVSVCRSISVKLDDIILHTKFAVDSPSCLLSPLGKVFYITLHLLLAV